MKSTVEALEGNKVKLLVKLDDNELDKAMDQAFKTIARQVSVPGFRPGKAPRRIIEARIGNEAARAQALNDSLPDFYVTAVKENDLDVIAQPDMKISSGEKEGPVAFEATVEVRPIPQLAGYQGLRVTVPNPEPSAEEIDEQLERMRGQYGELNEVDRAARKGDFVTLDIAGTHEGEAVPGLTADDYSYEVGSGLQSLGADFDSQVEASKVGDEKEFTSPVPPNDLEVEFKVRIKGVSERKLPELTDEWATEVSEFGSVEELRIDIAERFREVRKSEASRAFRAGVIEAVAGLVEEEIPEALVNTEMTRQLQDVAGSLSQQGFELQQYLEATGQTQEDFVADLRKAAAASVRADLALRSVAEKEGLEVTDEDIDAEIVLLAAVLEQKPAKVRRQLESAEQMAAVRSDIRKTKAVRWLMDEVEVVDSEGRKVDRALLQPEQPDSAEGDGPEKSGHGDKIDQEDEVENEGKTNV